MTKYQLRGLDCPVCAKNLEDALAKLEGVRAVSIDFGTLSMRVEALDLGALESEARRLEPGLVMERGDAARGSGAGKSEGSGAAGGAGAGGASRAAESGETEAYELKREILFFALAALIASGTLAAEWLARLRGLELPGYATLLPFLAAYFLAGWNVLAGAARNILRGRVFDELFLMGIATLGAFAIGQYEEAVGVMVFYKIGEMLQESAVARSRASVKALLELRPDTARLRRDGRWLELPAEDAAVGDEFLVLAGERLPLDGLVLEGQSFVDTAALTGEPTPRRAGPETPLLAGFIALDGSLTLRATAMAGESSAARIAELVENASHAKAKTERLISRFARVYTPIVVGLAAAVAFLPPLLIPGQELTDWAYRALVMLVISCPCALVVSVPLGYFGGIGGAARRGILVKGGEVLDALARAKTAVFDKTGTLTKGVFAVRAVKAAPGFTEEEVLELAAAAESRSGHPIAASIREAVRARGLSDGTEDEASEVRELPGRGLYARVGVRNVLIGNRRFLEEEGVALPSASSAGPAARPARDTAQGGMPTAGDIPEEEGLATVLLAVDGSYAGAMYIGDETKPDAAAAIADLKAQGVERIALLTGDAEAPARAVGSALGIQEIHAGLLPEDKLERLGALLETTGSSGSTLFIGDGLNDAPVLARADVGIAMGTGTDAAVESADVVLMTSEPSRVAEAVARAKRTRRIVLENIVFSLGVKAGFLALGALGIAVMWEAVIADVGVALLATLNASRAMR